MVTTYLSVFILGLSCIKVNGRAVNITSAWFLPQEGFPVFYRYFNDKLTWNEAEAVCGFHHADLLSVQSNAQMDAARAYLKEIDISDNIWIGLKKKSPEKPFSWTNGEKLLGDGYWLEPIPKTNEKLCAAIDPISDFRWNSFYCRGPQVASFVCELPVPEWAKKEDGCMITSLPSLTVTLIPEMGIIQLFSDCGLDGTRRIACKGGVNRKDIIKRLSCDEDAFGSTVFSKTTTDGVKEIYTQESLLEKDAKNANREKTSQVTKPAETHLPQTRHKREVKMSTEVTSVQMDTEASSITSTPVTSTHRANVLNVPSRLFPHSPSQKNAPSTKATTTNFENDNIMTPTQDDKEITSSYPNQGTSPVNDNSSMTEIFPKLPVAQKPKNQTATKTSDKQLQKSSVSLNTDDPDTENRFPSSKISNAVPVLIITGDISNDSSTPASLTSENPGLLFMIEEKEGSPEPYLVPLAGDIVINKPSLSPMEIVDVDLVEIDNLTTTKPESTANAQSTATPSEDSHRLHPLRVGKMNVILNTTQNMTSTPVSVVSTQSATPTAPLTSINGTAAPQPTRVAATEDVKQQLQNTDESVSSSLEENAEIPKRPNRGRLLTHSSHPSFYPYFLNRVLG